jgi:integrase
MHRLHDEESPFHRYKSYSRYCKIIENKKGKQRVIKLPIAAEHVKEMLNNIQPEVAQRRDTLAVVLATICALRPSEVTALQVCDLKFDYDRQVSHREQYAGTLAVVIRERKNDQSGKGHFPRIGKAKNPKFDIVSLLKQYLQDNNLMVSSACTKPTDARGNCPHCNPLFPKTCKSAGITIPTMQPLSTNWFTSNVSRQLRTLGHDPKRFSGISARKGGISSAIEDGVEEAVVYLQSGHSARSSGRDYMTITNLPRLYEAWGSFQL